MPTYPYDPLAYLDADDFQALRAERDDRAIRASLRASSYPLPPASDFAPRDAQGKPAIFGPDPF